MPRPQSKQVELDVAAVADENVPATQEEQAEDSSPVVASVNETAHLTGIE